VFGTKKEGSTEKRTQKEGESGFLMNLAIAEDVEIADLRS
jgi:hypothetical protein